MPVTSSVNEKHPSYIENSEDMRVCRFCHEGERAVKEHGMEFLPPTPSQVQDGARGRDINNVGYLNFLDYKKGAVFPEVFTDAVRSSIGILHSKPATIELPEKMEYLRDNATVNGESLLTLLRKVNEEQLISGRAGLLAEVDAKADQIRIVFYKGETIINWDDGSASDPTIQRLNLVVLDESAPERTGFAWTDVEKYRVLSLGDFSDNEGVGESVPYQSQLHKLASVGGEAGDTMKFTEGDLVVPSVAGNTFDEIPFVFINSSDLVPEPDMPPLLGVARRCMTIYRGEANLRQVLINAGDGTLVVVGTIMNEASDGNEGGSIRIGAGSYINVAADGDAKFIGIDSSSLPHQIDVLKSDYDRARQQGAKLIEDNGGLVESGRAMNIRSATNSASIRDVALTGASGIERILKAIAVVLGADPGKVSVTPHTDFKDEILTGREAMDYQSAMLAGMPLSRRSFHSLLRRRGVTDMTFEDEMDEIESQSDNIPGGDPESSIDDENDNPESGGSVDS